jgi:hypothetical protein
MLPQKEFILPSGVTCVVTPFVGADFDLLQNPEISQEQRLLQILARRVKQIGTNKDITADTIEKLTATDFTTILIMMRNLSFARRNKVEVLYNWGTAKEKDEVLHEIPITLQGFNIRYVNGASADKATVKSYADVFAAKTVVLQDFGKELEYSPCSMKNAQEKNLAIRHKLRYKRDDGNYEMLDTSLLSADDYLDLVELLKDCEGSIDTKAILVHPKNGSKATIDLLTLPNFLFPLRHQS